LAIASVAKPPVADQRSHILPAFFALFRRYEIVLLRQAERGLPDR
jgi:hypothetical protein